MLLYFSDLLVNFHLLQSHVTCDSKLSQHSPVFFHLLSGEFFLHNLYWTNIVVDLINKMLSEVTKFKISMSYSGALAWVHHLHDDFQKSCFTSSIFTNYAYS